jgi:alpha-tubulin suppressor-like RCC1 family protein
LGPGAGGAGGSGSGGSASGGNPGGNGNDGSTNPVAPTLDSGSDTAGKPADAAGPDAPTVMGPCSGRPCLEKVVEVAAGAYFTCAIIEGGTVRCWGQGSGSRIGLGSNHGIPTVLQGLPAASAVEAGPENACVVATDGRVWCWGSSGRGSNAQPYGATPVQVEVIDSAVSVSAGFRGGCAVRRGGSLYCWSDDNYPNRAPVVVQGVPSATAVGLSGDYFEGTCALVTGGSVWCWTRRTAPAEIGQLSGATVMSAGSRHFCVVRSDRSVWCWGGNTAGELGNGTMTSSYDVPVKVVGISDAISVSAGDRFTCALSADGSVRCWGRNEVEQLGMGNGNTNPSSVPVPVSGVAGAKSISSGDGHTCAVVGGGKLICWGDNGDGQLGVGTTGGTMKPVMVVGQ